ncbi:acyltransferase [Rhizobium sp. BK376]|uniref:acyltransferase family protein n=1 Tax=Rhizobium sp. BK376 TaxID=2512149 RepID=UPI0010EC6428|nr:acyltransferase [Rhizobium sp. BK376]TCR65043.1 peptidoglycan/LPS O-acetylase OafA/YrhL [Rhizobium sp. BK376]
MTIFIVAAAFFIPLSLVAGYCAIFNLRLSSGQREATIDGARGFLALGVVVHHFSIHASRVTSGLWQEPSNVFFRNLGPLSVTIFFMITAYLFYGKIMLKQGNLDWISLYFGRLLRLTPMYMIAVLLVIFTAFSFTGFHLNVPFVSVVSSLIAWTSFTIFGSPDINGFSNTDLIIAKITWTLRYEWLFYLILPVLALLVTLIKSKILRIFIIVALIFLGMSFPDARVSWLKLTYAVPFALGMIVYEFSEYSNWRRFCAEPFGSLLASFLLVMNLSVPVRTYGALQFVEIALLFLLIVGGASFWGLLKWHATRVLGEATYGIYLLHAIFLFWLFSAAPAIGVMTWTLPVMTALVTTVSLIGFFTIERPIMQLGRRRPIDKTLAVDATS